MLWTHDLLVYYLWFIECPTNVYLTIEETLKFYVVPSQEVKKKPEEGPKPTRKGIEHKKTNPTKPKPATSIVHPIPTLPPPPPPPNATQNDRRKNALHLDDIALAMSPS